MDQNGLENVLTAVDSTYTEVDSRTGGSGFRVIRFDVIGIGKGHLKIYHARTWELRNHISDRIGVEHFVGKNIVVEVLPQESDL